MSQRSRDCTPRPPDSALLDGARLTTGRDGATGLEPATSGAGLGHPVRVTDYAAALSALSHTCRALLSIRCVVGGYNRRVPGPAPPVINGLQIDQALAFQRRFGRVQRVAWGLLAAVPVAAIAGLFGGGLFSKVTAGSESARARITYERFSRMTADTELQFEFVRPSRTTDVAISREFLDRYDTSDVRPEPLRVRTLADAVVFTFAAGPAGRATFVLQPDSVGSTTGTVTVTGGTPVRIRQLVYP
jgi:hypothetical protein